MAGARDVELHPPTEIRHSDLRAGLSKILTIAAVASLAACYLLGSSEGPRRDGYAVAKQAIAKTTPVVMDAKPPPGPDTADEASVKLLQYIAARSRWQAERDGYARLKLPAGFKKMSRNAAAIAANEQRLLEARRLAFESQLRDLRLKIAAVREEIDGFVLQRTAKEQEIGLIRQELHAVERMHARQLSNLPRLMSLKRELARAQWDIGSLHAAVARSRLTIKDFEQEIHVQQHRLVVDSEAGIRDIEVEIGALTKSPIDVGEPLIELALKTIGTLP